jgi:oligosaccharide repeat unit polymerase
MTALRRSVKVPRDAWTLTFVAIATLCIALTDAETFYVTAPLAVGLLTALVFLWSLSCRRHGAVPWFELGAVYLAAATLYFVYPLLGFLAIDGIYIRTNDLRLASLPPTPAEAGAIGWLYACHVVAFAAAYLVTRGRLPTAQSVPRPPGASIFMAVVVAYGLIEVFNVFLGLFFDMSSTTYAGSYLAARRLPLVLSQLLNHLSGVKYALSLMLLAALFTRYRRFKPVIITWLLLVAVITTARLGNRSDLVLLVMAAAMMYHTLIRPISPGQILSIGAVGLTGFVVFGALRGGAGTVSPVLSFNPFAYGSEFESLFANAVHLNRLSGSLGDFPPAFYLADLLAIVPQQLAPFTKIDRADWYVTTFFPGYAAIGGGLAFGTISEAILTGGWISALGWGAALGFAFAKVHRFYARHADHFWVFVFYVWITTLSYQAFRNSTFAHIVLIVYRFIPAVVIVSVLAMLIRRFGRARAHAQGTIAAEA